MSEFSQSFDARDWARAFVEHVTANAAIATDEGTMISWFASALMRGWDEHARRYPTDPLIHAVAKFDGTPRVSRDHFDACDTIFFEALKLARPHVDPDGYRLDARAAQMEAEFPYVRAVAGHTAVHYGNEKAVECGAEPPFRYSHRPEDVTCRTCRGWLPIVADDAWMPAAEALMLDGPASGAPDAVDVRSTDRTPSESTGASHDEEMVPHAFTSRTRYEPGDDRDIWCRDCEYHRDHKIHGASEPARS